VKGREGINGRILYGRTNFGRTRFFILILLLTACQSQPGETPSPSSSIYLPLTQTQPLPAPAIPPTAIPTLTNTPATEPRCTQPGFVQQDTLASQWAGTLAYRVYYPPCYTEDRAYPTLYLLPGNIHTDSIWDDMGIDETADSLIFSGSISPLLIVMADGGWLAQNSSGGPGSYESVVFDELIPHVEATTCAWAAPQGRAIGGLSRGGYWALEIAFRHPASFAGVGGHSAALLDTYAGPSINPRYTGLSQNLGDLRIYLDIGRDDYVITPLLALHDEMTAQQIVHTWLLNEGRHEEAYWTSHLADYLRWYGSLWEGEGTAVPSCKN